MGNTLERHLVDDETQMAASHQTSARDSQAGLNQLIFTV